MIGNRVQFIIAQTKHFLRKGHGVVRLLFEAVSLFFAVMTDKLVVELNVVPHERAIRRKLIKVRHDVRDIGRARQHFVVDSREPYDLAAQPHRTGDERRKLFADLSVSDLHRADLDDPVHRPADGRIIQPRRFKVEYDEIPFAQLCGRRALFLEQRALNGVAHGDGEHRAVTGRDGTATVPEQNPQADSPH